MNRRIYKLLLFCMVSMLSVCKRLRVYTLHNKKAVTAD